MRIEVIAHRGEHLRHPENTLPAYHAALEAGADFVEVDVRTTADGRLVVIHDATVDSKTSGKGAVKDLSLAQIRALTVQGMPVPTFEEVLIFVKNRGRVYVDAKQVAARALLEALDRHGMASQCVVYGGVDLLRQLPREAVMPEAQSVETAKQLIEELHPRVFAFDRRDFKDEIIAVAKGAKALVYVDRLGEDDHAASWQNAIDRGADGIQTDHPAELVEYLRAKGYR